MRSAKKSGIAQLNEYKPLIPMNKNNCLFFYPFRISGRLGLILVLFFTCCVSQGHSAGSCQDIPVERESLSPQSLFQNNPKLLQSIRSLEPVLSTASLSRMEEAIKNIRKAKNIRSVMDKRFFKKQGAMVVLDQVSFEDLRWLSRHENLNSTEYGLFELSNEKWIFMRRAEDLEQPPHFFQKLWRYLRGYGWVKMAENEIRLRLPPELTFLFEHGFVVTDIHSHPRPDSPDSKKPSILDHIFYNSPNSFIIHRDFFIPYDSYIEVKEWEDPQLYQTWMKEAQSKGAEAYYDLEHQYASQLQYRVIPWHSPSAADAFNQRNKSSLIYYLTWCKPWQRKKLLVQLYNRLGSAMFPLFDFFTEELHSLLDCNLAFREEWDRKTRLFASQSA
ncbi:MAG: hypothetical protein JW774_08740 [Candidatus Aureabacteria bacterium]|nr:hypothetical protein [Candidatus Auribacterota bacterium]